MYNEEQAMKKKSLSRWKRRHSGPVKELMPDSAIEKIAEWERRLDEDPQNTPKVLELNWKDRNCLLGGMTIERLPPEGE